MPNYDTHVLSGVVSYPLVVFIAFILRDHAGIPFVLSSMAMVVGYAFYVLGADLPDVDHPSALIHRGTKPIVAVAVGSAVFMKVPDYINLNLGSEGLNVTAAWLLGALTAVVAWYGFTALMPRHRGIVHSLLAAAVYGLLAYALMEFGLGMGTGESLFVGFSAFSGYTLHLLLDREVSLL
ncbi:hydrolase [Thermococcus sp. P6]|uniref:metal-dependent hydrolase n=1 Tax=Thermococcus sp. P6 TaxID=122420 RepID=UPI000B5A0653|nr:metal-dependent hydrolase [Thermococcus sp. P6]ASJ10616.1 hydrolase [Thermococcus sp. P6]